MNEIRTFEQELIYTHQKDLKMVQKVCIFLVIFSFMFGFVSGFILGVVSK